MNGTDRSPLGMVVGRLLAAASFHDPMDDYAGFTPDPAPTWWRVAAELGWTFTAIDRELTRRGVSAGWQFKQGLGCILDTNPRNAPRYSTWEGL